MKLTKLYIHNYKSFYDTTIELDKLNIVVGENNSGKSNLIDVLEFIDIAMSKDIERAISDKGGYDKIKNYSAVGEEKVIVRATFSPFSRKKIVSDLDQHFYDNNTYTLSLSFSKKYYMISIQIKDRFILINKHYWNSKKDSKNKLYMYRSTDKEKMDLRYLYTNIGIYVDSKLTIKGYDIFNQRSISTYYFNTQNIRDKSNQDNKNIELLKDGSNLGKVLFEIKENNKDNFEIISNSLITTVNEIENVEVQKVLGSYAIGFKERGEESIAIHTVSDGTINFLATMTALNQYSESFLLVFEEPERHLHLNAINYMLQAFRDSEKQILITTHSTEILKHAEIEEIVFIYRDTEGDTQSIRADAIPNLKRKMKRLAYERDVTLDELIGEGMIGNFE
ncbi:MAG: Unknown protein [uncultured Sulfurovum sp.]|uniref:ATPase AAA-type core domain-containing protein n=1 Tax=uncultured Sulfurovum sp. TaxID=269237 RepID=A0A6S6U093_9BACT|nr:MAG: Unknown protein [uncultured Sulfurovum sp.]